MKDETQGEALVGSRDPRGSSKDRASGLGEKPGR